MHKTGTPSRHDTAHRQHQEHRKTRYFEASGCWCRHRHTTTTTSKLPVSCHHACLPLLAPLLLCDCMHYIIVFQSTQHEKAHDTQRRYDRRFPRSVGGTGRVCCCFNLCSVLIIQEEGVCAAGYFFLPFEDFLPREDPRCCIIRVHTLGRMTSPARGILPASLYSSHCCCCLRRSTSLYRFAPPCLFVVYVPLHLHVYACLQSSRGSGTFLEYCSGIASVQTIQLHDNSAPALR